MKIASQGFAVIDGDEFISKWALETGRLDHDQSLLPRILPHIPVGGTVVDAGAYVGDHTIAYLQRVGPTGTVIAFEPHPHALFCLRHNCPRAIIYPVALGDQTQAVRLALNPSNPGASYLGNGEGSPSLTVSLDALELEKLDFLKLDVEGYELKVLAGATLTLARCNPVILAEINKDALARQCVSFDRVTRWLKTYGYRWQFVYSEHNESMPQFDVICFPML